jgi:hypothetical protein
VADESGKPARRPNGRYAIGLASAAEAADAIAAALDALPATDRDLPNQTQIAIVVPHGWHDATARAVMARLEAQLAGDGSPALKTLRFWTPGVAGQFAAAMRERWIETALGPGAERFDRVRSPSRMLGLALVFVAPAGGSDMPAVRPTEIAAAFAHPRQRAAARFDTDPAALAELAMPLAPRLTLALACIGGRWLAAAAADPVAAELAWLGLAALASRRGELVAWQDPVVQRLSLLGPFAQRPDDLLLAADPSVDPATLVAFAEELGVLLPGESIRGDK